MGGGHPNGPDAAETGDDNTARDEEGQVGTGTAAGSKSVAKEGKKQLVGKKLKLKKCLWTPYSKTEKQCLALCFNVFMSMHCDSYILCMCF